MSLTVSNPNMEGSDEEEANRNFVQINAEESEDGEIEFAETENNGSVDSDGANAGEANISQLSRQERIQQLDVEMKEKIEELHKLMFDGGLTESARLLDSCMPKKVHGNGKGRNSRKVDKGQCSDDLGVNVNENASAARQENQVIGSTEKGVREKLDGMVNMAKSLETIYESAVPKRNSSSSEEEIINTSGESDKTDNILVNNFIADIRDRRGNDNDDRSFGRNDRFHYTRPMSQTRYPDDDAQPSTSTGRGQPRSEPVMLTPEEKAEKMIKQAENAKARIFATPGKNSNVGEKGIAECYEEPLFQRLNASSFLIDEGFIVVGAHLDDSMISKIQRGEYVDFGKLIPRDRMVSEEDGRLEMMIKNGRTYWAPVNNGVNINSFGKWEQAFRVFSNVYCKTSPERAAELIEYNHVIHTIANHYVWDNVYLYDKDFRLHMSRNPSRNWSLILQQSWALRLRDRLSSNQFGNFNNNGGNNRSKNNEPCRRFNRGHCNFGSNCRYEHRCTYCGKFGHGAVNCRKAIADRNGNNNNQNHHNPGNGGSGGGNGSNNSFTKDRRSGGGGSSAAIEQSKPIQATN